MRPQSVIICGQHGLLRAFLRAWLSRFNELHVAGEAETIPQVLDLVKKHKPALVLMDFDTLQELRLDLLSHLRKVFPKVKVIIYFAYANDDITIKLVRAGAAGFVTKNAQSEDFENAIRTVLGGGVYLSADFLKSLSSAGSVADSDGKSLSPRQAEILKLIALGMSTKAVAFELKISPKTVDVHKQALMSRIGVKTTTDLVKYAIRIGLVPA
jgi:DNA-binding NarL/FixJ family response regulator